MRKKLIKTNKYMGFSDWEDSEKYHVTYAWCIIPGTTWRDDIKNGFIYKDDGSK